MLYRLAVSPRLAGAARALAPQRAGVPAAAGARAIAVPAALAAAARLPFRDDESNDDPGFARNRVRAEVLPVLRELSTAAERNMAETRAEVAEEASVLEGVVLEELQAMGAGAGAVEVDAKALATPGCRAAAPLPARPGREGRGAARRPRPGSGGGDHAYRRPSGGRRGGPRLGPASRLRERDGGLRHLLGRRGRARARGAQRCRAGRGSGHGRSARSFIRPRSTRRAPTSQPSTPARWTARSRSGPGARATGCSPWGWRARRRSATSSPSAACRAPQRHRVPIVTVGGEVAWVAGVAVCDRFRLDAGTRGGRDLERPADRVGEPGPEIGETLVARGGPRASRRRAGRRDQPRLRRVATCS